MINTENNMRKTKISKVLLVHGGWEEHCPDEIAAFTKQELLLNYEVTSTDDLGALNPENLSNFDLFVPIWTFGEITKEQETALINAVSEGLGLVSWHGNTSAFLESRLHKFLLGGQFVAHPGGNNTEYRVNFQANDPITEGLIDFSVTSEQYYLLIDPAVKILATTLIDGAELYWLKNTVMPVAWKRNWGKGRVFYCSLGHSVQSLSNPSTIEMLKRALLWADRQSMSMNTSAY